MNEGSQSCSPADATPSQWWLMRNQGNTRSKVNKETGLAPDSWAAYERNEIREPRGLQVPIQRTLNSSTWYLTFDVQTAGSLCCKLTQHPTSPPDSLDQSSPSYWDAVWSTLQEENGQEDSSKALGSEVFYKSKIPLHCLQDKIQNTLPSAWMS